MVRQGADAQLLTSCAPSACLPHPHTPCRLTRVAQEPVEYTGGHAAAGAGIGALHQHEPAALVQPDSNRIVRCHLHQGRLERGQDTKMTGGAASGNGALPPWRAGRLAVP